MAKRPRIRPKQVIRIYLREWIEHVGLNQTELADRIGTNPATVSKYVNHPENLTLAAKIAIAEALGVAPAMLYLTPKTESLFEALEGADDEMIDVATRAVKGIVSKPN